MQMKIIKDIYYSSRFKKRLKRLPKHIQEKAADCENAFRNNCFDSQLKTHRWM